MRPRIFFSTKLSPDVLAFTTDRTVNFSFDLRASSLTAKQKKFLGEDRTKEFPYIFHLQQVHSGRVVLAHFKQKKIPQADAAVTNQPGIALVVRTADCLPIFVYDVRRRAIGLIHAGWRSTHKKIVTRTLDAMERYFGTKPRDVRVALGPALQSCCFEVGREFQRFFPNHVQERSGKLLFDMVGANKQELIERGILKKNIFDCARCTFCQKRFFSYRRQGAKAGRMISFCMLKK